MKTMYQKLCSLVAIFLHSLLIVAIASEALWALNEIYSISEPIESTYFVYMINSEVC